MQSAIAIDRARGRDHGVRRPHPLHARCSLLLTAKYDFGMLAFMPCVVAVYCSETRRKKPGSLCLFAERCARLVSFDKSLERLREMRTIPLWSCIGSGMSAGTKTEIGVRNRRPRRERPKSLADRSVAGLVVAEIAGPARRWQIFAKRWYRSDRLSAGPRRGPGRPAKARCRQDWLEGS